MSKTPYNDIYTIVRHIPSGKVLSYVLVAKRAGCHPRQIGYALARAGELQLPWHRVVNYCGKLSNPAIAQEQKQRLMAEGIVFIKPNQIDFSRHVWKIPELFLSLAPEDPYYDIELTS